MTNSKDIALLVEHIRNRTENLYEAHHLCCSEAIIYVMNKGLKGGMDDDTALMVGNGFCGGMGGGEGTCGALTGAVTIIGLFLSPHSKNGISKKNVRLAAKDLNDRFKEKLASINCDDLTREFQNQRKARLTNCQKITGIGAQLCAEIILQYRPELIKQADHNFLTATDSKFNVLADKFRSLLK